MSPLWPRYDQGSLALISSVAAWAGAPTGHKTLPELDQLLQSYRNVVMLLYDGMGMVTLEKHLPPDSFLRSHLKRSLSATYPSTTSAATTTLESGLTPAQHGWLGWSLYFPEIDQPVDLFINRNSLTGEPAAERSVVWQYQPYTKIFDRINQAGQAWAGLFSTYSDPPYHDLDSIYQGIIDRCAEPGRHYCYAYWNDPDHTMHGTGTCSGETRNVMLDLDQKTAAFADRLSADTLLLITADHGLVDAEHVYIEDHPALAEALLRPPTVEPRAAALYVREAYMERFPALFEAAFPGHFLLMKSRDAVLSGLFGPGTLHPRTLQNAGDYMAFSLDRTTLNWRRKDDPLKGVHAGLTADEMRVPLIVFGKEAE